MLLPGDAQERLKEFQRPDGAQSRKKAAAALPPELSGIALGLLGYRKDGSSPNDRSGTERPTEEASVRLAGCDAVERQRIFAALFPPLAPQVEAAWQMFARLPYQTGYARKAFRSAHHPIANHPARAQWLQGLLYATRDYEQDLTWYAAWAPYLYPGYAAYSADALGILFAAAIDAGGPAGDTVFEILTASARGEHEIGAMGRHVTRALLVASRPDGWEFVERLLLAAQREEGLRQTILETVDEAHPTAFRRMLRLIVDQNLIRFSACLRVIDVWFSFGWEVDDAKQAAVAVSQALRFLDDIPARENAVANGDAEAAYLALWAAAFEEAQASVVPAARLVTDPSAERRFAAVYLLTQLGLVDAQNALLPALEDDDLRVALTAFAAVQRGAEAAAQETDLFERLERLLERCPEKKKELPPIVWPWMKLAADRQAVAGSLLRNRGQRPPSRLLPHLVKMGPDDRFWMVGVLTDSGSPYLGVAERQRLLKEGTGEWQRDAATRETLFALTADPSPSVRERALEAVAYCQITLDEAQALERLLTRKSAETRRGVLAVLLNQADGAALASADRLLGAKDGGQRSAGLELLQQMAQAQRRPDACWQQAAAHEKRHTALGETETKLLEGLLNRRPAAASATLEDALGLMDPAQRSRTVPPKAVPGVKLVTPAALACLKSLDELVDAHRETPVMLQSWDGSQREELLGNMRWGFPPPKAGATREEALEALPLRELWETWWRDRSQSLRDADGFEFFRSMAGTTTSGEKAPWWREALESLFPGTKAPSLKYPQLVHAVLAWLIWLYPPEGSAQFLLDAVETSFAQLPPELLERKPNADGSFPLGWRGHSNRLTWLELARQHRSYFPDQWQDAHHARLWRLVHWLDQPFEQAPRLRPQLEEVLAGYHAGAATEADLLDQLLGPRPVEHRYGYSYGGRFDELHRLTGRKGSPLFEQDPILRDLVERCRERILEIECSRGDLPTAASVPAGSLRHVGGLEALARLLAALGKETFTRSWSWWGSGQSRSEVLSHLIRATRPAEEDTLSRFADRLRAVLGADVLSAGIRSFSTQHPRAQHRLQHRRLVELAMYAPQWATHVEQALDWPGLAEGVWWIHAHTKDTQWSVDPDVREAWAAETAERTALSAQSLLDGAVDVAWFGRAYAALGPERWAELDRAARFASGGGGHKRAQLFADAMLGRVSEPEVVARIQEKRHQDSVRALGLLPLAEGEQRQPAVLDRYQLLQEFARTSRQFGSQRQASEKLAATIALENLARTAGYPDPVRLEWAMEARAVADLKAGPLTASMGQVTVALAIDAWGKPELMVLKAGKPLKSIPAAAKKAPEVAALADRKREIERQASRMRQSLEEAMCRGDQFTGGELRRLIEHPLLTPLLRNLVFVSADSVGYPVDGGAALEDYAGRQHRLREGDRLRLAHPHDLLRTGEWDRWQQDCFRRERIQPFKQVFRELYVLTATEQSERALSHRYEGHQVQPRQALALLGRRGWVTHPEEGVRRVFHHEGIAAWIQFDAGFTTPAEVEGLTIESVGFSRRGEWKPLPLEEVPSRLFSEVMRDVDLVVSVAHRGGVDPEASASTVEMRAALLRESCTLWRLENVRLQGTHALIDGQLGSYSVHLGSAVVHRQPGGALCIVPVHSQHRGRLFLPFADDDPKTAEVVSKVLLLAKDKEIKDPTILEQILPR
jgi:hypothetical protein